jgi:hypothetical protein
MTSTIERRCQGTLPFTFRRAQRALRLKAPPEPARCLGVRVINPIRSNCSTICPVLIRDKPLAAEPAAEKPTPVFGFHTILTRTILAEPCSIYFIPASFAVPSPIRRLQTWR